MPTIDNSAIKLPTSVTISIQTARMAQQALNKLNGGDGHSKILIGQAEMEIEKVLASANGAQPQEPVESPDGIAEADITAKVK